MGLFGMKNRGDVQKMIVDHLAVIDEQLDWLPPSMIAPDAKLTRAQLLDAKSSALIALTNTLPKEK